MAGEEVWPALAYGEPHPWRSEPLEPGRLAALWSGAWQAPGPVAAVTGTLASCLKLLGRAADMAAAQGLAEALWRAKAAAACRLTGRFRSPRPGAGGRSPGCPATR